MSRIEVFVLALSLSASCALTTPAKAEAMVYAGAWSEHLIQGEDLNEHHDLVGIERDGWFAGRFINSHFRETLAVAYHWTRQRGDVEYGAFLGAMYGYTRCIGEDGTGKDVCPLVVPTAAYTKHRIQPVIMLMGDALAIGFRVGL